MDDDVTTTGAEQWTLMMSNKNDDLMKTKTLYCGCAYVYIGEKEAEEEEEEYGRNKRKSKAEEFFHSIVLHE